jgi:hypothetical protein
MQHGVASYVPFHDPLPRMAVVIPALDLGYTSCRPSSGGTLVFSCTQLRVSGNNLPAVDLPVMWTVEQERERKMKRLGGGVRLGENTTVHVTTVSGAP